VTQFAVALTRTIKAPRSQVYRACLDPELLQRWMCPPSFVVTAATVEERVGGVHRVEMVAPDGERHAFDSIIEELVPDERIVLRFRFDVDAEETLLTLTLRDAGGGTELRLDHERIPRRPPLDERSVDAGWGAALDKLQALYEKEPQ
jgi:uncharacterized protein YndB with AHSA1/START domain